MHTPEQDSISMGKRKKEEMERTIDIGAMRFLLEEQRLELIRQITEKAKKIEKQESDSDRSALAQRYVNQQRRSNAIVHAEQILEQVEKAIQRIEDGKFGICLSCGQPIQPNRLKALPNTEMCIDCKEEHENNVFTW
jgi:DnaK suppressor protein